MIDSRSSLSKTLSMFFMALAPKNPLYANTNLEFDTDVFRFSYASLTTPSSTYDYNLVSKERSLLKHTNRPVY